MTRGGRFAVVLGAAAVVGFVLVLWGSRPRSVAEERAAERAPASEPNAPVLQGGGLARRENEPAEGSPAPVEPAGDSAAAAATHRLEGRVVGVPGDDLRLTEVRVTGLRTDHRDSKAREVTAEADGSFRIDLSPLFASGAAVLGLEVEAIHPRYLRAKALVPVEPEASPGVTPRRFAVEVSLHRAANVTGTLVDPDGRPMDAQLGIFVIRDGVPEPQPIDRQRPAMDGRWRLQVGDAGRYVVVASSEAWLPAAREVDLAPGGGEQDVGALAFRRGAELSGTVRFRGSPAPGAELDANGRHAGTRLFLGPDVIWTPRAVLPAESSAKADGEGRYRFDGLSPGIAQISVDDLPGRWLHMQMSEATERDVQVPATGVDFDVDGIDLVVAVRSAQGPLAEADVMVAIEGTVHGQTDEKGEFTLVVPLGAEVTLQVDSEGLERAKPKFRVPEMGTSHRVEVVLEPRRARPAIVLRFRPPEGRSVSAAGVAWFPVEPGRPEEWPSNHVDANGEANEVRVTSAPGRHRLRVRPGGPWFGGTAHWLEAETVVDVPTVGEVEVVLELREGGRLRIAARSPDGRMLPARCTLVDATGRDVPFVFVSRVPGGLSAGGRTLHGESIDDVDPPLEPGTYRVTFEADGHATKTVEAKVEVGRTTDVDVTLTPSR